MAAAVDRVRKACDKLEAGGVIVPGSAAAKDLFDDVCGVVAKAIERGACEDVDGFITSELKKSTAWRRFHSELINDMHEALYGGPATAAVVGNLLETCDDADQIATRLKRLRGHDGAAPIVSDCAAPLVDESWIDEFIGAYGRHPHVHEYVHLRRLCKDLPSQAEEQREACSAVRDVHARYLDQNLSKADFARTYLLRSLNERDLAARVLKWAVHRPEYATAMKQRIAAVYESQSGDRLPDAEIEHVFDTTVFPSELPLDTDELNGVIRDYIRRGDEISAEIRRVFDLYLQREAQTEEVAEWHFRMRVDPSAKNSMRKKLVGSLEFHHVLGKTVRQQRPGVPAPQLFAVLASALERESELLGAEEKHDFVRCYNR
jgi:hypothetical protein